MTPEQFQATDDAAVRIWQINDCEWVVARTASEAVEVSCLQSGQTAEDTVTDGYPRALTDEELHRFKFRRDGEVGAVTFLDELKARLERGDKPPFFFATTEE